MNTQRRPRRSTLASLAIWLVCAADPATAGACSISRDWSHRPESFFMGTALLEIVRVGPGDVPRSASFSVRPGDTASVYGQIVRISQVGGGANGPLARATRQGIREAVLVPWGYGADCRTIGWDGKMPWAMSGTTELFSGTLRDRSRWVGGVPTIDVMLAYSEPYPQRDSFGKRFAASGAALTAQQAFSLLSVLPVREGTRQTRHLAFAPLFRWAMDNPELARLHPARDALESASYALKPCLSTPSVWGAAGTNRPEAGSPGRSCR